jgi:SNF2 family DNA or RNA helicase
MEHQEAAVAKIAPLRVGALFMEMGTGKTRTAIELVRRRLGKIDRVVWFCPVALKETVCHEILKHTDTQPECINVFNEKTEDTRLPKVLWHIIGIESMSSSTRMIVAANKVVTKKTMVIVDESSYIKGHDAMRTLRITKFAERARYRLLLTGTPLSQGVVDLFSQMRFLSPQILGYNSFYSFAANHLEYHEKYKGMIVRAHNVGLLAAKIAPYAYHVRKDECLQLPEKLYDYRYCSLSNEQTDAYVEAKDEFERRVMEAEEREYALTSMAIFRLFTSLQQIVSGFWNRFNERGVLVERLKLPHRRLELLMDTVTSIPPDEKIIIWAKYHQCIQDIVAALTEQFGAESVVQFHGGYTEKKRHEELARFRKDARFFVATQSCGGHGLTLNEVCYSIFYNNSFKFSERLQAEDRCHRIGQTRKTMYIDICCQGTIDERISKALANKESMLEAFKQKVEEMKDIPTKKKALKEFLKEL